MTLDDIDTPAVLVDLDIAERNIAAYQAYCDEHGIALRPHIKTHKLPFLARQQVAAGARGITCQKLSEAEVMIAEGGIDDVLITYPILGPAKVARLRALAERVTLASVADSIAVIDGLDAGFEGATPLRVLVECDTGAERCGVTSPEKAVELARRIDAAPNLTFGGIMTYPPKRDTAGTQEKLSAIVTAMTDAGLPPETVSSGGSPDMWRAHEAPVATEYRVGTYVYNDRSLVEAGTCAIDDCALTVLVTVVSVPSADRAVIDAGSKVLTSDLLGLDGHGHVLGRPDLRIAGLSEEHGVLRADTIGLKVGDRLRIIPNHCCVVSNMMDEVQLHRSGTPLVPAPVVARGKVV
ncbi:D-TA family PLP-dependent enzyme [Pelagovum pacificum]|uniref:D-TA family PLP-dependent enzyme n=1 Tax=Pelagovum pacificum TaxID=2588711 RepID=A0A5C5GGM1_9RHOB|nr:D-TA family PLP-dependent enzyme [Pelagovum pacificum]QQA43012.1 D-TA family PLP-dependent enzyme [Pelagovum pacificum]TNY33843.1 D-TA family PLP-dependent enzyme [Pelagovum pacificum]